MREILFRGKIINTNDDRIGEWLFGALVVRPDHDGGSDKCFICESGFRFIHCINKMPHTYEVKPETVGQYTGLNDKYGKRICEGDIVKTRLEGGTYASFEWPQMRVAFEDGAFCLIDRKSGVFNPLYAFNNNVTFEVIGNIHDNPELIAEVEG